MGLLKSLLNLGVAYAQHVTAVRNALALSEAEAVAALSSYVRGLSDASFVGFKMSVGGMAGKETDPAVKQSLNWIANSADAWRQGKLAASAQQALPKPETELSFDSTIDMIEPWWEMSEAERFAQLNATLTRMTEGERRQFVVHLNTAVGNSSRYLQSLRANESSAWGGSVEDRMNYGMARLKTGSSDPAYAQQIARAEYAVRQYQLLADKAANWRPPSSQKTSRSPAQAKESKTAAALPSTTADSAVADNVALKRMVQKMQAGELDGELFDLLAEALEWDIAAGRVPPGRVFAFRELCAEIRSVAEAERAGRLSGKEVLVEVKRIYARSQELISTAGHAVVEDDTASCARAQALLPYLQDLKTLAAGDALETRSKNTMVAKLELAQRVSRIVHHLPTLKDDAAVIGFERTDVRALALAVREVAMLPHLTLARPFWDCPRQPIAPNRLFFAGADDARNILDGVCKQKRLKLVAGVEVQNYGQARWDALRASAIAVFDWRGYDPEQTAQNSAAALELAGVAYEQGLSIALGTPAVVLAQASQRLPFDIDIEPLFLTASNKTRDRAALEVALDAALYGSQRKVSNSGLQATAAWLDVALADHPQRSTFEGMGWLDPKHDSDPACFRADVDCLLTHWGENAPVVLFPAWRAAYPATDAAAGKRLFHVMPFSQPWSKAIAKAAESICGKKGVIYERGDSSADDRILRRVWQGICTADFVLVDITGLNPNVMLELGMAHALGRNALIVTQAEDVRRVRNLEKIEIEKYSDQRQLQSLVGKWLTEGLAT